MNKFIFNIMFIAFVLSNTSYNTYSIIIDKKKDLDVISKMGVIIDHYHRDNLIHILATDIQYEEIVESGYIINRINFIYIGSKKYFSIQIQYSMYA